MSTVFLSTGMLQQPILLMGNLTKIAITVKKYFYIFRKSLPISKLLSFTILIRSYLKYIFLTSIHHNKVLLDVICLPCLHRYVSQMG